MEQTTLPPLDEEALDHAFVEAIKLARVMKQRIQLDEPGVGEVFAGQIAPLFKTAGATLDEALHYMQRIILAVLAEPQA